MELTREQFRDQLLDNVAEAMELTEGEATSVVVVACPHGSVEVVPVPPHYDQPGKKIAYAWAMAVARTQGTHLAVVSDVYIRHYEGVEELPHDIPPPSEDPLASEALLVMEAKDGDVWSAHREYERVEGGGWRWRHDWQEFSQGAETDSWMATALGLCSISEPVSDETMDQLTRAVMVHQFQYDELSSN